MTARGAFERVVQPGGRVPKGKPYFQEKGGKSAQKKGKNKKAPKGQKAQAKQMPFSRKVPV